MTPSDDTSADALYEQVLDFARREIEDASAVMDELRQSLRQVEARVEAAKSIYEAIAARLNLEEELTEEAHRDAVPDRPLKPPEEPAANNEAKDELDLIQKSLDERDKAAQSLLNRPAVSASEENPGSTDDASVLSDAERALIGEHLRSKRKG